MQILLIKNYAGALIPLHEEDREKLESFAPGSTIRANVIEFRNADFFRKWFKLLQVGFDIWSESAPLRLYQGQEIKPEFEWFRKHITILAGYYVPVYSVDGNEIRLEAQSVAWEKMNEDTFKKLYSATIDVLLDKVLANTSCTAAQLEDWAQRILDFDR